MRLPDLHETRHRLLSGHSGAGEEIDRSLAVARSAVCEHAFLALDEDAARASAARADARRHPLAGLAVSVKDLFDVAGQVTRAGSRVLDDAPPARADALAVARLRAAGGAIIGRTNMTEFAFSGVGINPHFGTPANAAWRDRPRIPGGSSSGAAVSVASGAAFVGLGSDTGGSIRIPAALHGLVGFKNTQSLTPLDGTLPLSHTLDTVCAITRSVRDAVQVHEILAARRVTRSHAPLASYRLAVVPDLFLDDLDPVVAATFERTLRALRAAGARIEERPLPAVRDVALMQGGGGFSAAESYAWHRELLARHGSGYDPRVRTRIERGASMLAADYLQLFEHRRQWIARMDAALRDVDAVLSPTVPIVAPALDDLAPGASRDDAFFRANALLLRNPSFVNLLDGCALSLPCPVQDDAPVGLMLWHGAHHDDALLNIGTRIESALHAR